MTQDVNFFTLKLNDNIKRQGINSDNTSKNASQIDVNKSQQGETSSAISGAQGEISAIGNQKSAIAQTLNGLSVSLQSVAADTPEYQEIKNQISAQEFSLESLLQEETALKQKEAVYQNTLKEQKQEGTGLKSIADTLAGENTTLQTEHAEITVSLQEAQKQEEAQKVAYETSGEGHKEVYYEDGTSERTVIDGKNVKTAKYDANGTMTSMEETDGTNAKTTKYGDNGKKLSEEIVKDGNVHTATYDGKGNTQIVVKAGESMPVLYDKFGKDNDALKAEFQRLNPNVEMTDTNLKSFFNQKVAYLNGQEGKLRYEGLQAGQTLLIPTEISAEDKGLQARGTASEEKARGVAAEQKRIGNVVQNGGYTNSQQVLDSPSNAHDMAVKLASAEFGSKALGNGKLAIGSEFDALVKNYEDAIRSSNGGNTVFNAGQSVNLPVSGNRKEQMKQEVFNNWIVDIAKGEASQFAGEQKELNGASGAHQSGNIIASEAAKKRVALANSLEANDTTDVARTLTLMNGNGTLKADVSTSDLIRLRKDCEQYSKNPNDKALADSISKRIAKYTGQDFSIQFNQARTSNQRGAAFVQALEMDIVSAIGGPMADLATVLTSFDTASLVEGDFSGAALKSARNFVHGTFNPMSSLVQAAIDDTNADNSKYLKRNAVKLPKM